MADARRLRVNVTWGRDTTANDRIRSILATLGLDEVARDEVASLFAAPPAALARRPAPRRAASAGAS